MPNNHYISQIQFTKAQSINDLVVIESLAKEIWELHYTSIIGAEQVAYMLQKFQNIAPMQQQIDEGYTYTMVHYKDEVCGYISFQLRDNYLFLSKIYVHPKFQGKGIGQAALQFVENYAKEQGADFIQLTVNKYNTRTIAIYERFGFERVKEAVFDIGNGFVMDDYVMEFRL